VRVVGTNQDVTKARTAEKKLQAALATAQAANNAKSEFLANMSHELRTPLNAIIGFSEMLASESLAPSLSQRDRGYAADIHESGQHLLEIISDILDFSRAEAGQTDTQEELIDTRSLLDWVVRLLGEKARAKNLRLVVEVRPNAGSFYGDLRLLRQTLLNILSNAVKFTLAGEIRFLATKNDQGALAISVADTGIGMRPEDIPVALTPFLQLENSLQRHYDGIGLGLPLAKRFVELHGGTFSITSELQKGTTVTIELPGQAGGWSDTPV
jgi:signal transduction histidine kinase